MNLTVTVRGRQFDRLGRAYLLWYSLDLCESDGALYSLVE